MPVRFTAEGADIRASPRIGSHGDGAAALNHASSWCTGRCVTQKQQFLGDDAPIAGLCTRTAHPPYYNLFAYSNIFRPGRHVQRPTQPAHARIA